MTRGDLPERWLNRPVKPVAIGTLLATGALCLNQFLLLTGNKAFLYTPQGSIGTIFVLSLITIVLMFGSWIAVSQHMYQVSLLFGVGTWVGRAVEEALGFDLVWQGILPLSIGVVLAGSYVLEAADDDVQ